MIKMLKILVVLQEVNAFQESYFLSIFDSFDTLTVLKDTLVL